MTDESKARPAKASPAKTQPASDNGSKTGRPMPSDYAISLDTYARGGTDNFLLNPPEKQIQPMQGFEDQYTDIIDYIVRITHHIWEDGNIGYIYDTYARDDVHTRW